MNASVDIDTESQNKITYIFRGNKGQDRLEQIFWSNVIAAVKYLIKYCFPKINKQ